MRKGKGKEAKLVFMAHALMDNRHGLVSDFRLTEASGMAERDTATHASERSSMTWVRSVCRTPIRISEVIITHKPRYKVRKRVESIFGWMKTVGSFRRSRYRGVERTGLYGDLVATAYNLVRMSRLIGEEETKVPVIA